MRSLLAVLLIAGLVAPAMGDTYFGVTADGAFNTYRGGSEGYTNAGNVGTPRMGKSNQEMGFLSFYGAVADGSGQSLASFLSANPGATAKLYVRTGTALPATQSYAMISIRSGNQGGLVEDQGGGNSNTTPATGFAGASENVAFRGASTAPLTSFPNFGDGIYTLEDPTRTDGVQGEAWITPSTRAANAGKTPFQTSAGQPIRYDKGIWAGGAATNKYLGYFADTTAGRNFWAVEDLLGLYNQRGYGDATTVAAAGQIVNSTFVDSSLYVASDPRQLGGPSADWLAIPVDAAFLADLATTQNKGLVFSNTYNVAGGATGTGAKEGFANTSFYAQDQSGGVFEAYLAVTPEPATMVLLALGGLVALRRRTA